MPQLVKGGKYVFGWSIISEYGGILIPEEALHEYQQVSKIGLKISTSGRI